MRLSSAAFLLALAVISGPLFAFHTITTASYSGALYDTHSHPTDDESILGVNLNTTINNLNRNNVQFVLSLDSADEEKPLNASASGNFVLALPGRAFPLFKPNTASITDVEQNLTAARVREVFSTYPFLRGMGEFGLYRSPFTTNNIAPDNARFSAMYTALAELGKIVMIHPNIGQATELSNAMAANPNLTFLVHGLDEIDSQIMTLMASHPNFYFTIDTANLIRDPTNGFRDPLMFSPERTKSYFTSVYDAQADVILSSAVAKWKSRIETRPTRFMWGTDAALTWHYDADIYDRLVAFSRAFIANLDSSVQNLYAIANATTVFQSPPASIMTIAGGDAKVIGGLNGYVDPSQGEKLHILATPSGGGTITARIYDRRGRLIDEVSQTTSGSQTTVQWGPGEDVGSGIYMAFIEGPGIRLKQKFAIVRAGDEEGD